MKFILNKIQIQIKSFNTSFNFSAFKWQFSSQAIGFIYLIVITSVRAKSLSLENFANISIALAFVAAVQSIFNFQTWRGVIKFGNDKLEKGKSEAYFNIIKNGLLIDFISSIFTFICIISLSEFISNIFSWGELVNYYIQILSISVILNFSQGAILGFFRLNNMFVFLAKRQILIYILFLASNISIYYLEPEPIYFIYLHVSQILLNETVNVFYFYKTLRASNQNNLSLKGFAFDTQFIKFNFWIYLKSIFDIPYRTLDIVLASKLLSLSDTGIYSALKRIFNSMNQILEPINIILYPKLSKFVGRGEIDKGFSFITYLNKRVSMFFSIIAIFFIFFSRDILKHLFSDSFLVGQNSLIIFIITRIPIYGFQFYFSFFIALGYAKQSVFISFISSLIFLLSTIILSKYFGLTGFVFGVSIFTLLSTLLVIIYLKTKYKFKII
jgi:O-antigen/teichoic acid export membrane protein